MTIEKHISEGISKSTSSAVNFDGTWKNRLDSEMELSSDKSGKIIGKYRTGVGKPTSTEEFDLNGFISGDLIVFCVNFGKYGSLTSWAGQHTVDEADNEKIYTLWHLVRNVKDEDEDEKLWASILAGSNEYARVR